MDLIKSTVSCLWLNNYGNCIPQQASNSQQTFMMSTAQLTSSCQVIARVRGPSWKGGCLSPRDPETKPWVGTFPPRPSKQSKAALAGGEAIFKFASQNTHHHITTSAMSGTDTVEHRTTPRGRAHSLGHALPQVVRCLARASCRVARHAAACKEGGVYARKDVLRGSQPGGAVRLRPKRAQRRHQLRGHHPTTPHHTPAR